MISSEASPYIMRKAGIFAQLSFHVGIGICISHMYLKCLSCRMRFPLFGWSLPVPLSCCSPSTAPKNKTYKCPLTRLIITCAHFASWNAFEAALGSFEARGPSSRLSHPFTQLTVFKPKLVRNRPWKLSETLILTPLPSNLPHALFTEPDEQHTN
jgi:hypothetical protein